MKILGIIAEYNPYHNGHSYLLEAARHTVSPDYCIAVMSGNFLQRGEAALFDKYKRSELAILCGLDAVYELPAYYACSSAEEFAAAAVITMKDLSVTHLAFGVECDNLALLKRLAAATISEGSAFTAFLKERIAAGETYAAAYSYALCQCVAEPDISDILAQPNNMLALCYLRAILRYCPEIEPVLVHRKNAMYHDTELRGHIASAGAIRAQLLKQGITEDIIQTMPPAAGMRLPRRNRGLKYLSNQDFSQLLSYALLGSTPDGLSGIYDISGELANRMAELSRAFSDFDTLTDTLKTRQYTRTRISRSLIHLLLSMKQDIFYNARHAGYIFYVRLLGFAKSCSPLIKYQKTHCPVPFIQKVSQAEAALDEALTAAPAPGDSTPAKQLFLADLHASDLYRLCWYHKYGEVLPDDYRTNAQIIEE